MRPTQSKFTRPETELGQENRAAESKSPTKSISGCGAESGVEVAESGRKGERNRVSPCHERAARDQSGGNKSRCDS